MQRPTPVQLSAAIVALVALGAFSGCGDTTADTPAGESAATTCTSEPGDTVTVEIPDFEFSPDPVQITACDSVVWKNVHDQAHTSTGKADKTWSTGTIAAGAQSDPVRFESPGSYAYMCALHPFMHGTVEVS